LLKARIVEQSQAGGAPQTNRVVLIVAKGTANSAPLALPGREDERGVDWAALKASPPIEELLPIRVVAAQAGLDLPKRACGAGRLAFDADVVDRSVALHALLEALRAKEVLVGALCLALGACQPIGASLARVEAGGALEGIAQVAALWALL